MQRTIKTANGREQSIEDQIIEPTDFVEKELINPCSVYHQGRKISTGKLSSSTNEGNNERN